MKAIDHLKAEHRRIEGMLVTLEAAAIEIEATGAIPSFLTDLLDFFQQYADVGHHAKEDALLFPAMAAHGVAVYGTIGAMTHQHELGRIHLRDMRNAIDRLRAGAAAARVTFATSAHSYVELLRVHIQIEDDDVYPVAEQLLSAEEGRVLLEEFEAADNTPGAMAREARWDALVARIHEPARH